MALQDVTIFQTLRAKLDWHQKRQGVLAQNVANSDTPNYRAKDITEFSVAVQDPRFKSVHMVATSHMHMGMGNNVGLQQGRSLQNTSMQTYEIRPSGNSISNEEQMAQMSENAMQYQANAAMLQKIIGMYRTALGRR